MAPFALPRIALVSAAERVGRVNLALPSPLLPAGAGQRAPGLRILHLSADYPDPLAPQKTRAVANLLELVEARHRVISLNRTGRLLDREAWHGAMTATGFADAAGPAHQAVAYAAPPRGLRLRRCLERLAAWIEADCVAAGFAPDVIHAHKLSIEGPVGLALARRFGVPLMITIQGDSDTKILRARPDLRPLWRQCWREAAVVLPLAPWANAQVGQMLGPRYRPVRPLPCPLDPAMDTPLPPCPGPPVILSAFHLGAARRKNAAALIRAAGLAAQAEPELRLEIAGGGDPAMAEALERLAARAAPGRVRLLGPLAPAELRRRANAAAGFAVVSRRESYGMVFAEALLAGAPCLYPRGRAIEGWLPEGGVVLAADPGDVGEMARGMIRLVRDQTALKARLAVLGRSGGLDMLRRPSIAAGYGAALEEALALANTRS